MNTFLSERKSKSPLSARLSHFLNWQCICLTNHQDIQSVKRNFLGEFEELVMLTIAVLNQQAYGVAVTQEIERQTGRVVDFSSVHTTMKRLQEKGFLTSGLGGATPERGGRRKRLYTITTSGYQVLKEVQQVRSQLWEMIPNKLQWETL